MTDDEIVEGRLALFDHRRGRMMAIFSVIVTLGVAVMFFVDTNSKLEAGDTQSVEIDFFVFWGAAKLAAAGVPLEALNPESVREAAGVTGEEWMPWSYPPAFLLALTPLASLGFQAAWAAFVAVSIAAIVLATRPLVGGRLPLLCIAALAPAFGPALLMGQTSTLWAAGLVAAMVALKNNRLILAGMFLGLLTFKPQMGLLIPVALIAMGAWPSVVSAALSCAVIMGTATLVFGWDYWPGWLEMTALHSDTVRSSISEVILMVSPYSMFSGMGIPEQIALNLQLPITVFCAAAVFLTWRREQVNLDAKAAVLITSILLSSPYLWFYETALLAPAALFMLRAGILRLEPWGICLGIAMWLGLALHVMASMEWNEADILRFYIVPLTVAALLTCLNHVRKANGAHQTASAI
ncbi:MAG: glycosyltransferase family 87 protein [Pseudomonadota bacterium]